MITSIWDAIVMKRVAQGGVRLAMFLADDDQEEEEGFASTT